MVIGISYCNDYREILLILFKQNPVAMAIRRCCFYGYIEILLP